MAAVQDDIVTVAVDVEKNAVNITKVSKDVVSLASSDQQQTMQIESLTSSDQHQASMIESLSTRGTWRSFKAGPWSTSNAIITYDHLTFTDSNINITGGTPLDINSGNYILQSQLLKLDLQSAGSSPNLTYPLDSDLDTSHKFPKVLGLRVEELATPH